MGLETICKGGKGSKATAYVQIRNEFPGPGGVVKTSSDFVVAHRVPNIVSNLDDESDYLDSLCEKDNTLKTALNDFMRHALIKKFDDYFLRTGKYHFPHIPRPLGVTSKGGYIYEWAHGHEGYYDEYYDQDYERWIPVRVDEYNNASGAFNSAGISIFYDISETEGGHYTKNIVIQEPHQPAAPEEISKLWKRIDFGYESMKIDFDKMTEFIKNNKATMELYLKPERVEMMELIIDFLRTSSTINTSEKYDRLKELLFSFRQSTANHMSSQWVNVIENLNWVDIRDVSPDMIEEHPNISLRRLIRESETSRLELQVRSYFPCFNHMVYTTQDYPVAEISRETDEDKMIGFKMFLKQFIAKKLENLFILQGKYTYTHIVRPLGFEDKKYWYEWAYGKDICTRDLIERSVYGEKKMGLDEWCDFVSEFYEAGIDFQTNLRFMSRSDPENAYAKQIIVRQPTSGKTDYISRMWKRVNMHERSTIFDLCKLKEYITDRKAEIGEILREETANTLLLATRYLKGEKLKYRERESLVRSSFNYCIAAAQNIICHDGAMPAEYAMHNAAFPIITNKDMPFKEMASKIK